MDLTTTSYAILGLLDVQDWTAYELTQQARRSLAFLWPISESQLYAEPKRLARNGLITIKHRPAGPQRTRQLLKITAKGRKALRAWLGTEPAPPRAQMEILLRTFFATSGTKDDLLAALESTRDIVEQSFATGRALLDDYAKGDNPFPERLHANILWITFMNDLLLLTSRWVTFATAEVEGWRDSVTGGDRDRAQRLIEEMAVRGSVLSEVEAARDRFRRD